MVLRMVGEPSSAPGPRRRPPGPSVHRPHGNDFSSRRRRPTTARSVCGHGPGLPSPPPAVSAPDRYRHVRAIPTRWKDTDVYGHVNNVEYYSYFDTVINAWLI